VNVVDNKLNGSAEVNNVPDGKPIEGTDYVVGINGEIFTTIPNIKNSICYLISTIHRIHICKSLKPVLQKVFQGNSNKYIKDVLTGLYYYSTITPSNIIQTKRDITNWLHYFLETYVNNPQNGYLPEIVLTTIILPAIFASCDPKTFDIILTEIHIDIDNISFSTVDVNNECFNPDSGNRWLKDQYLPLASKLYSDMVKYLDNDDNKNHWKYVDSNFQASVLELYPDKHDEFRGHAVAFIKCPNNKFIVIDDQRNLLDIFQFINNHINSLDQFVLRDVPEKDYDLFYNELPNKCKDVKIIKTLTKKVIESTVKTLGLSGGLYNQPTKADDVIPGMDGGDVIDDMLTTEMRLKYFIIIAIGVLFIVYFIVTSIKDSYQPLKNEHFIGRLLHKTEPEMYYKDGYRVLAPVETAKN